MAEQIKRTYFEIIDELFLMKDSAISKLAKVRFTEYEMRLWHDHGYQLSEASPEARKYFEKRFLGGISISNATPEEISKAFTNLGYAVGDPDDETEISGCRKRCFRLMNELNVCLKDLGLETMTNKQIDALLDSLTFKYHTVTNGLGLPIIDRGAEIRVFTDKVNRKDFADVLKKLKKEGNAMSMRDICESIKDWRSRPRVALR